MQFKKGKIKIGHIIFENIAILNAMELMMTQENRTAEMSEVNASLSVVNGTVHCKRISKPTAFQIQYSIQRAIELANTQNLRHYLVDARGTFPPSAELRQVLRKFLSNFIGHFDVVVVVVDNPTLRVSTKFIFHNHEISELMNVHICETVEDGLEYLSQL